MGAGKGTRHGEPGPQAGTMQVDLNALIDAIVSGISRLPSALVAGLLLAGPTVIWLIARFTNPPDPGKRAVAGETLLWVCEACRSINDHVVDNCYRCHRPRGAESGAIVVEPGRIRVPGVGIAVGPGVPSPQPTASSWLSAEPAHYPPSTAWPAEPDPAHAYPLPEPAYVYAEAVRESEPAVEYGDEGDEPEPAVEYAEADDADEPALEYADEEDEPEDLEETDEFVGPVILDPRVKVSSRPSTASTGRQLESGATDANGPKKTKAKSRQT